MRQRGQPARQARASGGQTAGGRAGAERRCVHCRASRPAEALLQLAATPRATGRLGRRQHVCISRTCLAAAASAGGNAAWGQDLAALAAARLYGLVGLARRAGTLAVGGDAADRTQRGGGFELVGADAGPRSLRRPRAHAFGTSAGLAQAAGVAQTAVLSMAPGALAKRAAYWWRVWYEARDLMARDGGAPERVVRRSGETD